MMLKSEGMSLKEAALKSGMDRKTARSYARAGKLPSQLKRDRCYRTRPDVFKEIWPEIEAKLETAPGLEAKTIFENVCEQYPGRFQEGQLRTLQRRIRIWRALEGPPKEVFFSQVYTPGEFCASDFTHLDCLNITIGGSPFPHMLYHFVLPYSNWETGTVCFSESFQGLSQGFQNALWSLGGVPKIHRTDRLSAAVNNLHNQAAFTRRYAELLGHYGLAAQKTNPYKGNENGDAEQSHNRIKKALEQVLLLRGSREFGSREIYDDFIQKLFDKRNAVRSDRLAEEQKSLTPLPDRRVEDCRKYYLKVTAGSTIRAGHITYSVHSRLIGERVEARLFVDRVEVWYAQQKIEQIPRQRVSKGHFIQYRHIIEWLVRKPGAFAHYRYRDELFPSTNFRMAYDQLKGSRSALDADKEYLRILLMASQHGETQIDRILSVLAGTISISKQAIEDLLTKEIDGCYDLEIPPAELSVYDALLGVAS